MMQKMNWIISYIYVMLTNVIFRLQSSRFGDAMFITNDMHMDEK